MRTMDRVIRVALVVTLSALAFAGYQHAKGLVLAELYQEKLASLAEEYELVRGRYNDAVKRSAVTELVVNDGKIVVRVRGADRLLKTIETDLDPTHEIHVDFVVRDSRLLMRRLYDDRTAPADGLVVDPKLDAIDWSDAAIARGISVYRGDLAPGRWVVSSSGNGALELTRAADDEVVVLADAPSVRRYDEMARQIDEQLEAVGTLEILARLTTKVF